MLSLYFSPRKMLAVSALRIALALISKNEASISKTTKRIVRFKRGDPIPVQVEQKEDRRVRDENRLQEKTDLVEIKLCIERSRGAGKIAQWNKGLPVQSPILEKKKISMVLQGNYNQEFGNEKAAGLYYDSPLPHAMIAFLATLL